MSEQRIITPGEVERPLSPEAVAVQDVLGLDPTQMDQAEREEYDALVSITMQFSRHDPVTGERQIISPSRIEAIPAITARHCKLVAPARGVLTVEQVKSQWHQNMPENDGETSSGFAL